MKHTIVVGRLGIACLCPLAAYASSINASVSPNTSIVGSTVVVDISVSAVDSLYAFEVDLSYDPLVLSAEATNEAGYFAVNGVAFVPGTIDNSSGTIRFIADSLTGQGPGYSGDTLLATATFTAIGTGATTISPINIILLDDGLVEIPASVTAASVTVSGTTATPEPNETVSLAIALGLSWIMRCRRRRIIRAD